MNRYRRQSLLKVPVLKHDDPKLKMMARDLHIVAPYYNDPGPDFIRASDLDDLKRRLAEHNIVLPDLDSSILAACIRKIVFRNVCQFIEVVKAACVDHKSIWDTSYPGYADRVANELMKTNVVNNFPRMENDGILSRAWFCRAEAVFEWFHHDPSKHSYSTVCLGDIEARIVLEAATTFYLAWGRINADVKRLFMEVGKANFVVPAPERGFEDNWYSGLTEFQIESKATHSTKFNLGVEAVKKATMLWEKELESQ